VGAVGASYPYIWLVSVEGLEPSTNGLKGRILPFAAPIQKTALFDTIHWSDGRKSLLDVIIKVSQCCITEILPSFHQQTITTCQPWVDVSFLQTGVDYA